MELADLVGVDATGETIFSLIELAGLGPYTAGSLLETFQLSQGVTGDQTLTLVDAISGAEIDAVVAFEPRTGGSIAGLLGYCPEEYVTTDSDRRDLGTLPVLSVEMGFTWSFWVNANETGTSDVVLGNRFGADGFDLFPREWIKFTPTCFEWRHTEDSNHIRNELTPFETGVWAHYLVVQDGPIAGWTCAQLRQAHGTQSTCLKE